jgi:hypothetical protein
MNVIPALQYQTFGEAQRSAIGQTSNQANDPEKPHHKKDVEHWRSLPVSNGNDDAMDRQHTEDQDDAFFARRVVW